MNDSIDWNESLRLVNQNVGLAQELLTMLVNDLPDDIAKITAHYQQQNYPAMIDAVHKLHGGCRYCGVPKLRDLTHQIEASLKHHEFKKVEQLIPAFIEEIAAVRQEFLLLSFK